MISQRIHNHILIPCDVIYIYLTSHRFGCDIFYVNGVGFHSYFGYSKTVSTELNGNDFISAFAERAKGLGKFVSVLTIRSF